MVALPPLTPFNFLTSQLFKTKKSIHFLFFPSTTNHFPFFINPSKFPISYLHCILTVTSPTHPFSPTSSIHRASTTYTSLWHTPQTTAPPSRSSSWSAQEETTLSFYNPSSPSCLTSTLWPSWSTPPKR